MQTSLSGLFAGILIPFTRAYPRIDVRIFRDTSAGLYAKLMNGEIDAAITSQPPFAIPKTCEWHILREEPFVVLTATSVKSRNAHEVLATEPFIRLDRKVFAGRLIDDYLRKTGIRPKDRYELDGLELIAVMVDRGLGVSLLQIGRRHGRKGSPCASCRSPAESLFAGQVCFGFAVRCARD